MRRREDKTCHYYSIRNRFIGHQQQRHATTVMDQIIGPSSRLAQPTNTSHSHIAHVIQQESYQMEVTHKHNAIEELSDQRDRKMRRKVKEHPSEIYSTATYCLCADGTASVSVKWMPRRRSKTGASNYLLLPPVY